MALDGPSIQALVPCPKCGREMRLFGIEAENDVRDLFTFECERCDEIAVRGVGSPPIRGNYFSRCNRSGCEVTI